MMYGNVGVYRRRAELDGAVQDDEFGSVVLRLLRGCIDAKRPLSWKI